MSCGKGNIISIQCTNCMTSSNQINEVYSMFCACGLRFCMHVNLVNQVSSMKKPINWSNLPDPRRRSHGRPNRCFGEVGQQIEGE